MKKGFFILFFLGFISSASAEVWPEGRPLTVAHRGANREFDENTLAAYARAMELGVDMIECDPRLTRDGVYVIMHDPLAERTTNGHGAISNMTLAAVKTLRTKGGHEVPTLEEVLRLAKEKGVAVYLDMKDMPKDGGESLVALLDQTGMRERVIVGVWSKKFLREIERRWPDLITCISWPWPPATFGQLERMGADSVGSLVGGMNRLTIKLAHRHHLKTITMPINDRQKLLHKQAIGLDALQTDDPRLLSPLPPSQLSTLLPSHLPTRVQFMLF